MKKIFSLVFACVFAFGLTAFADESNVKFNKSKRGPDKNGVYTLSLEAYVTGNVTVTESPAPADIVLVLDRSGSMGWNLAGTANASGASQRLNMLKSAVQGFVDVVKTSDGKIKNEDKDTFGGHRIAFVWFSSSVYDSNNSNSNFNKFLSVSSLETAEAYTRWGTYHAAQVNYGTTDMLGVNASGMTADGLAMEKAKSILSAVSYPANSKRSRIVVFFTDGEPGGNTSSGRDWMNNADDLKAANDCISAAFTIKNSETYKATVYSVGLFQKAAGAKDATTTFLSYTSSDHNDKKAMPANNSANFESVSGDKSIVVSSSDALANVFSSIAASSTPNTSAASSSSVLIDVVSTSFKLPEDTDLGTVKVYQVANKQTSSSSILEGSFAPRDEWVDITDKSWLDLDQDLATGEVSVTGFDYGEEWCGWDASYEVDGVRVGKAHGSKLVLEIPIMANEDAVGGVNVATNAPGSKLVIKDASGKEISTHEFVSPEISLPINIHIMKKGLKEGESARYTIRRTTAPASSTSTWDYVSSVFVTNGQSTPSQSIKFDDKGVYAGVVEKNETVPDTYTTETNHVCYVRGLPPGIKNSDGSVTPYVYKIEEDTWGWSYTFDKVIGMGVLSINEETNTVISGPITISNKNEVYSDKFVSNPIIFCNNREEDVDQRVRNAESKATNFFENGGSVKYDDSKTNTGAGR